MHFTRRAFTGNDPKTTAIAAGFDALQDILAIAHDTSGGKKRVEAHCWITTHVIWSSETSAPSQPGHVFNAHSEYLMQDSTGNRFIGEGYYLDPGHPGAQLVYIRGKPLFGSMLYSYRVPNSGTVDRAGTLAYVRDNHQPTLVDVPTIPWKTTPTKAIIRGSVTRQSDGAAVYNATLTINTSPARNRKTEPHGAFAFFETPPGTYTNTATGTDLGDVTTNITVIAGTNRAIALVLPPDSTPPVISSVGTSNRTDTSVILRWLTDENATSAVDYGTTAAYGTTVSNATLKLNHALSLTGLTPNTTYHYRVRSRNATGLQSASADFTFTSNPPGVVNDVIVEARLLGGGLNSSPPYSDEGFADSTQKALRQA